MYGVGGGEHVAKVGLFRFQACSRWRDREGLESAPEIFRLELNSATKVEFFY